MARLTTLACLLADPPHNSLAKPPTTLLGLMSTLAPKKEPETFPRFEPYLDNVGEWRWRLKARNYKTIADSGEGYKNYADMLHAIDLIRECINAPIHFGRV